MTLVERFPPGRHPLCTCPDRIEWPFGVQIDPATCAGGATAHPVFTLDNVLDLALRFDALRLEP